MSDIRISKMYFTTATPTAFLGLVPLLSIIVSTTSVCAQVIAADDNTDTVIEIVGDRFDIKGGQYSGDNTNLFQSFEQFDITTEHTANFVTTPEIQNIIGRINSGNASTINGTLQVSGGDANLYLMNPAGLFIGPNAQLNLSGGFTATTATAIGFENGQFEVSGDASYRSLNSVPQAFQFYHEQTGAVVNLADLAVLNGESIALIGGTVVNTGSLSAPDGTVTLAAVEGENLVRIRQGNQLLSLEIEANDASLTTASLMTPQSIGEMLTGSGLTDAIALVKRSDGTVYLSQATGEIGVNEQGGSAIASGTLSTVGEWGGNINVLGDRITLTDAHIDASGTNSGGLIRIGGDYQGKGAVHNAIQTLIDENTVVAANALENGGGGRIIIWADDNTSFYGTISAQGGQLGGNGGFSEVSGKNQLTFNGTANLSAVQGERGQLLLDPENITIGAGPSDTNYTNYLSLEALSLVSDISITASNNITIEDLPDTTFPYGNAITFTPETTIEFIADSDGDGGGQFMMNPGDTIRVKRGDVNISGAGIILGTISTSESFLNNPGGNSGIAAGNVSLNSSQGITATSIDSRGLMNNGENFSADGGNVFLNATNGNIHIADSILTSSITNRNSSGDGGDIELIASGNITVGRLESLSHTTLNNAGEGGAIKLTALTGNISVNENIETQSEAGKNNAGNGGAVALTANGNINTQAINTQSTVGRNNASNGGAVSLSANGNIETDSIVTANGNVTLAAPGSIEIEFIDASGAANNASPTLVDITTQSSFRTTGIIEATGASISTVGTNSGAVNIAYNNNPFVVGNRTENGTAGSITTPTANLTSGRFFNSHAEGNITLINGGIPPVGPPTEPPIEPPVEPPIEPPVEPPIEPPVEPPTEPPVEPPTEPTTTEPSTELTTTEPPVDLLEESLKPTIDPSTRQQPSSTELIVDSLEVSQIENLTLPQLSSGVVRDRSESALTRKVPASRPNLMMVETKSIAHIFEQIETGSTQAFSEYLNLDENPQKSASITIETVQETLAEIELAADIQPAIVYVYFVPNANSEEVLLSESPGDASPINRPMHPDDELEVMVITPHAAPIRQRQSGITRTQVTAASRTLRQQVTSQFSTPNQYLQPAQQLYDWIMAPISQTLAQRDIDSLGFVMDTGLRTLPLATLHDGDRYLIENYSLGLLPTFSLTEFDRGQQGGDRNTFQTAQVLAMGASKFENQPDLPAVDAEIQLITEQLLEGDAFLNEEFVLENIQTQLGNKAYDILHLATHAVFEAGDLENSYIQLWNDELTLTELAGLKLDEAEIDLMILSACNTAVGDRASEYGFAGFAVNAGSRSALASLWPVNDEGTLGFMSQFYAQLGKESIRAEALQHAQISLLEGAVGITDGIVYGPDDEILARLPELAESGQWDFSHPFYWSAFTMIGNPW